MTGIIAGGIALLIFGLLFNQFVAWLQAQGIGDFTAWQVIIGVLVVLFMQAWAGYGQTFTSDGWALLSLTYFTCAGGPMAWGSWHRRRQ